MRAPVLQIHPSRHCNLRCLHCYSSSGPQERGELELPLVYDLLADAAAEGYAVASISGGEPLLYTGLVSALQRAHACGLATSLTTNGMLLDERRLSGLRQNLDFLAISLDGVPASHDRMRGMPGAFAGMQGRLDGLRASALRFGFIFTLTRTNVHELDWVARFALDEGASLLQIHPLEEIGRAREALAGARPDAIEAGVAYLEFARLQDLLRGRVDLQLDFAHRLLVREQPWRVLPGHQVEDPSGAPLGELVTPLVVEADARVVPLQHGFPRRFEVGTLREARLRDLSRPWSRDVFPSFRTHCEAVRQQLLAEEGVPIFNWYERASAG